MFPADDAAYTRHILVHARREAERLDVAEADDVIEALDRLLFALRRPATAAEQRRERRSEGRRLAAWTEMPGPWRPTGPSVA